MARRVNKAKKDRKPKDDTNYKSSNEKADEKSKDEDKAKTESGNDPEWYNRDPQLVVDAASLPFNTPLGAPFSVADPEFGIFADSMSAMAQTAGIMTLSVKPAFGTMRNAASPAMKAATALYSHVRYVNSGRKNYDPADLFMYVAAITDLYAYVSYAQRIYSAAFMYSQANRYIGKDLLRAMGVIPDSVVKNLANFRYWINTFINKVSSFAIPKDITLIYRRAYQFAGLYIEHEGGSLKDQLYMWVPDGFYKFVLDDRALGALDYIPMVQGQSTRTVEEIMAYGESLLENIWGDEDFGLISGDITKAFGGNIIQLASLPAESLLLPVYDPLVLAQMENATICQDQRDASKSNWLTFKVENSYYPVGTVHQDVLGNLVSYEAVTDPRDNWDEDYPPEIAARIAKPLNLRFDQENPQYILEAAQMMVGARWQGVEDDPVLYTSDHNPDPNALLLDVGAGYVTTCYTWIRSKMGDSLVAHRVYSGVQEEADAVDIYDSMVLHFKYAPKIYALSRSASEIGRYVGISCVNNLDLFALVTNQQIRRLQEVSILSLLYVPGVAKYVNSLS